MNGKGIQEKEEIKVQKDKGKEKRVMENIWKKWFFPRD
jgi:hypothetical protein